ncbi:hypothetical protein [Tenacibaculum sp. SDUM215027]|uniref:hypothetical protein n=1 Tax=Tenacibaculum sp. SDUM215027 TaxID=3422596 RepID=UPI003D312AF3
MTIEVTTTPNEQAPKIISQGIIDFNHSKIPDLEPIEEEIKVFTFTNWQTKPFMKRLATNILQQLTITPKNILLPT